MAMGPGKYDDMCSLVRKHVGMDDSSGGGVVVIIFGGNRGTGFSCQADLETTMMLPTILEQVANQIRKDTAP